MSAEQHDHTDGYGGSILGAAAGLLLMNGHTLEWIIEQVTLAAKAIEAAKVRPDLIERLGDVMTSTVMDLTEGQGS